MPDKNQNPYTPDKVPVEIPIITPSNPPKKNVDWSIALMVFGISVFVVVIFIQAYFLVQKTSILPTEASNSGPQLQQ